MGETLADKRILDLSGLWDFAFLGEADPDGIDPGNIAYTTSMTVPGCFDASFAFAGKRGLAAYRLVVEGYRGGGRLIFEAVHHWCRVFIQGKRIGEHAGGFARFELEFPEGEGRLEIHVLVDNRLDGVRCRTHLDYYDWYHYGGITGKVFLACPSDIIIERAEASTIDFAAREVEFRAWWRRGSYPRERRARSVEGVFVVSVAGQVRLTVPVSLEGKRGFVSRSLRLPELGLWSCENPELHKAKISLADDLREFNFGIREFKVAGKEFLLNGMPILLRGFNRHQAHPEFGSALPPQIALSDIHILKDLNCNFVRGAHYPQSEDFLELCDRFGILVWSEATGWEQTESQLQDAGFLAEMETNVREMVLAASRHPSVVIWGLLNESEDRTIAAKRGFERLIGTLRSLDPERPVTYGCMFPHDSICLDLVDIISINAYPGWYYAEMEEIPAKLDEIFESIRRKGQGGKPFILSEIGAAGIYGFRDPSCPRWSEEYQDRLLKKVTDHIFGSVPMVQGLAIWQLFDARSTDSIARVLGRARSFNNKGVLDEYRRPKTAYATVKSLYAKLARKGKENSGDEFPR